MLRVGRALLAMDFYSSSSSSYHYYSLSSIAAAAAVIVFLVCLPSFLRAAKRRLPPPAGTVLHQLLYFSTVHDYHTGLAARHKTFRLLRPGHSFFYTVDPAVVEHVLRTNFVRYGKGFFNYDNLKDLFGDGIFAVDGERWRHQRKVASYEFSTKNLREFSSDVFRKNSAKLALMVSDAAVSNKSMDIQDLLMRSTMDSIFTVGFGVELDTLSGLSEEGKAFAAAFDEASDLILRRYVDLSWKIKRLLNVGSEAALKRDIRVIDEFVYSVIRSKAESFSKQQKFLMAKPDILSRFLVEKEKDPEKMNDKYLRDIILNILIAGRDTTAVTLAWFFYMLCVHPSLQDRIAQEVEEATGADSSSTDMAGFSSKLTEEALNKMQFLYAALTETLRLYPAIPEDPKICLSDDTLLGCFDIKEGDVICYSPYSMGRMRSLWGENAEEFRPQRWLDENGDFQPDSPFKFTAFQAGPRICLGKEFAYRQMMIVSSVLIHFFRFKLKDEAKKVCYKSTITLRIDQGLHLLAYRRRPIDATVNHLD